MDLLPKVDRAGFRQLLNEYVALRIEAVEERTAEQAAQTIERTEKLQSDLWSRTVALADKQPTGETTLFVQSVNKLIGLYQTWITVGFYFRLPGVVWLVLFGLAIVVMAMGGYASALSSRRRLIVINMSAALAFSVVLLLVVALGRPHRHLSTATRSAMLDLQDSFRSMQSQP